MLNTTVKLILTVVALYLVLRQIDVSQTKLVLSKTQPFWLVLATLMFVLSKLIASIRLNVLFKDIGLQISENQNLRLYWVGMFYNLFLPGGIGGDGYKVYVLNKNHGVPVKKLVLATLWDRLGGVIALVFLALVLMLVSIRLPEIIPLQSILSTAACILAFPAGYVLTMFIFKDFKGSYFRTSLQSVGVQVSQVICAYFILLSLSVDGLFIEYQIMFLISSVVAVLPFTIGGVGARELTFILGHDLLGIDKEISVVFSLLFFLITAVSSLAGAFIKVEKVESTHPV